MKVRELVRESKSWSDSCILQLLCGLGLLCQNECRDLQLIYISYSGRSTCVSVVQRGQSGEGGEERRKDWFERHSANRHSPAHSPTLILLLALKDGSAERYSPSTHTRADCHTGPMSSLANILIRDPDPRRADDETPDRPSKKRPAARGTASYSRKRAVTACQVCRARKTKCDNLKPSCSFCLSVGATCTQSPVDLSSFDPASLRILERLDDLTQLIQSQDARRRTTSPPLRESRVAMQVCDLLPCSAEELLARDEFAALDASGQSQTTHEYRTPHMPVTSPGWEAESTPASVTALLDNFFQNVHVKNPVLDEAKIRRTVLRLSLHGFDHSSNSCLALLLCALGSISSTYGVGSSHSRESPEYMIGISYFQAASKRLGPLLVEGGLATAQCLFLSGVFMATIFETSTAWRYFLQALACCQELRLVPWSNTEKQTEAEAQLVAAGQAVYWSAWKSELEMRTILKPLDFPLRNDSLYPSFFPTPPAMSTDQLASDEADARRQRLSWYFYLSEISLRRLATRIQQEIVQTQADSTRDTLGALAELEPQWRKEARDWLSNLPPELSLESSSESDDICKFVLRGHLLNIYELIYWPFVMAVLNVDLHMKVVSQSTLDLANKGLQAHVDRFVVNQPGFYHRHHGTMFMLRACTRSALVLILAGRLAAKGPIVGLTLPDGWRYHVQQCAAVNDFWRFDEPMFGDWGHALDLACTE